MCIWVVILVSGIYIYKFWWVGEIECVFCGVYFICKLVIKGDGMIRMF